MSGRVMGPFESCEVRVAATGLRFPEGPVACDDGSVLVVEIEGGTLARVGHDGTFGVVAACGGHANFERQGGDALVAFALP